MLCSLLLTCAHVNSIRIEIVYFVFVCFFSFYFPRVGSQFLIEIGVKFLRKQRHYWWQNVAIFVCVCVHRFWICGMNVPVCLSSDVVSYCTFYPFHLVCMENTWPAAVALFTLSALRTSVAIDNYHYAITVARPFSIVCPSSIAEYATLQIDLITWLHCIWFGFNNTNTNTHSIFRTINEKLMHFNVLWLKIGLNFV